MSELKFIDQTVKPGVEKIEVSLNAFEKIQEGIDVKMLEDTYIKWQDKTITSDEELEVAKKEKNSLVPIRTGVEKKRMEIIRPFNEVATRLKKHGDGLQDMVRKVEDVINNKITAYEQIEKQRQREVYESKLKTITDYFDPLYDLCSKIESLSDCKQVIDKAKEWEGDENFLGKDLLDKALDLKNQLIGKVSFRKEKLLELKELELLEKEQEQARKEDERASKEIENLESLKSVTDKKDDFEGIVLEIKSNAVITEEDVLFEELFKLHLASDYKLYSEKFNSMDRKMIYPFLRWVIENTSYDKTKVVELLKWI